MIISKIKPYRQPQFDSPTLELNGDRMTITNPNSNGDFASWFELFVDGKLYYSAKIVDNVFSSNAPIETEEILHDFKARIKTTNEIRSSAYSNVETAGKLAAPVATIEGDKLVLYNAATFGNATDIDIYINGKYSKTISADSEATEIEILISDLIATGRNTFSALSKNVDDTRWLSSALSNEVKSFGDNVLYLSVARNSMASGTTETYAVFAGGLTYNSAGQSGVVEAYDETLTHIMTTDDLLQYDNVLGGTRAVSVNGKFLIKCKNAYCVFDEDLTLQTLNGDALKSGFAVGVGWYAIFAGGYTSLPANDCVADAVAIEVDMLTVQSIQPLSVARYNGGSARTDFYGIFCGGASSSGSSLKSVDCYDESLMKIPLADMASAKKDFVGAKAAGGFGGYAVFAGGGASAQGTADGFAYNEDLVMVGIENLTVKRSGHRATSCRSSAVFAGNETTAGYTDVVEIYSDELVKTNRNIPVAKSYVAMASVDDLCLIAGGRYASGDGEETSNTVDVLIFD